MQCMKLIQSWFAPITSLFVGALHPDNIYANNRILCLLFYGIATVFQLYYGGNLMYKMRGRKTEPTILLSQGIVNLPHNMGMV